MKKPFLLVLLLTGICLFPTLGFAQSTVTFQVDMSDAIKDSTFFPSQHTVEIRGNQLPFSRTRTIKMQQSTAENDSIYVADVRFPSVVNGRELQYSFLIQQRYEQIEESNPRSLELSRKDQTLSIVRFNQFAQ